MNRHITSLRRRKGFTLLEVLIAILIFSLGLIGLAGLLVASVRSNHTAYVHTQATFLAQSIQNRMRANIIGVWGSTAAVSYYDATALTTTAPNPDDCTDALCTPQQVAKVDLYVWSQQLLQMLPNPQVPSGTNLIKCTPSATLPVTSGALTSTVSYSPPYNGYCTVNLVWSEVGGNDTANDLQKLTWVFQP